MVKPVYTPLQLRCGGYTKKYKSVLGLISATKIHDTVRVSERLLLNANSAIFHLYHGENMLIFNEMMMMRFALF